MPDNRPRIEGFGCLKHRKLAWMKSRDSGSPREIFSMNIQPDFKELLTLLEKHNVDYMIVGGYAVAFHGHPRFTKDIDIFFSSTRENIDKIIAALVEFGFPQTDLNPDIFLSEGNMITFGVAPVRVDFLNQIDGVNYDHARPKCIRGRYSDIEVTFIGREDLLKNKRSTERTKDKADVEELTGE